jgi:hypothetical protein
MAARGTADDGGECLVQHPALSPGWRPTLTGGCFEVQARGLGSVLLTGPGVNSGEGSDQELSLKKDGS